jgi:hypothetical protein
MGRVNKSVEGVFVDIVGSSTELSSYDVFMNIESKSLNLPVSKLKSFLGEYKKIITENKVEFERLAKIEEIIMQLRLLDIKDIKLSLVREYVYARCSFFRIGKTSKDIRVIVDNVEFWKSDMVKLSTNQEFMTKAKNKLIRAMEKEVDENIENFNFIIKTNNNVK